MTKVMDICPKCGSHLIIRDGPSGEFLACPRFPECRYTKPARDVMEIYKPPSPYCGKCNHTGLLPFVKNGKIIPNAFIDCECKFSLVEHYDPVRLHPEDFDFPMSDTFRAYSFEYCGQLDPDLIMLSTGIKEG